jgi:peptidoglycan/xylan/chitin deacetylase (PgdA/CDA1 family)
VRVLLRGLKTTLVSCVSLLAVVVPVYLFVSSTLPEDPPRLQTPVALALDRPGPQALTIPAYRGSVPVLSYHEVSDRPKAVSPKRFAAQMQLLADKGFHSVTISQLGAFLRSGRSLPERPIVISFDQALGSLWREVDPILESFDFRATAFIAPATVGQHLPYNLSSLELKKMVASQRWDIEAALAYIPEQRLGAARLDQLLASFERLRLPPPLAFLYPRGAIVSNAVAPRFPLSFQVGADPHFISRGDTPYQDLPLFAVLPTVTRTDLVELIEGASPLAPSVSNALDSAIDWRFEGGSYSEHAAEIKLGSFRPSSPAARHWLAAYYAPTRTRDWRNYQTTVEISSLGEAGSGADATIMIGSSSRVTLTLSANRLHVRTTDGEQETTAPVGPGSHHVLQVSAANGLVAVTVDDKPVVTVPAPVKGGIGLGIWREKDASPTPVFAKLTIGPADDG